MESKYKDDLLAISKMDGITLAELRKAMDSKNNTYGVNTNELDGSSILLNVGEFNYFDEIREDDYNYYLESIKKNRERARVKRELEEKYKKEEEAKLLELAEKQRKEAEEAAKREMEEEAKLDKLRDLLENYSGDKKDYGIQTAQAILNQGLTYKNLSPKQKWRIEKTLKDLEQHKEKGEKTYDFSKMKTNDDKVETKIEDKSEDKEVESKDDSKKAPVKPYANLNEENLKQLNDEDAACAVRLLLSMVNLKTEEDSNIAFSTKIALTINNTGKISDKQKNYLMKGYNKLRERQEKE